jgi:nucleoside-diphosphate-sugar epimerase
MKIAITGGAGFLGAALARRLLSASQVTIGGTTHDGVGELLIADLVAPPADISADPRVIVVTGELADTLHTLADADAIFHLAGVVSSAAEADFDLGMATNIDATRSVLELCRSRQQPPVLVFSSSLAVFGSDPALGAIGPVDDMTLPRPQSSYGIQKFIGEQLVAEYTRRGFVRGRSVRLMTVSVRPGRPNAAASSFLSSIIREPLAGERATCPVPPDTAVALSSPRKTLDGLLRAVGASDSEWGSHTAMNLPALTTTPREMVTALARVAGDDPASLVGWTNVPAIADIVTTWAAVFATPRAEALGLHAETSFDDIIRDYIATSQPQH